MQQWNRTYSLQNICYKKVKVIITQLEFTSIVLKQGKDVGSYFHFKSSSFLSSLVQDCETFFQKLTAKKQKVNQYIVKFNITNLDTFLSQHLSSSISAKHKYQHSNVNSLQKLVNYYALSVSK